MDRYWVAKRAAGIAFVACCAHPAQADIVWNGFMTAGGGIASIDDKDGEYADQTTLDGYEEDLTFNQDTKLGLQLRAPLSDKLSATGQLVARGSENYKVDMAWAYFSYQASESTQIRMGRFRTPFYLYSDFLEVGYAYHWISPPEDAYQLPTDSIDGIDIVVQAPVGPTDLSVQVYGGSVNTQFTEGDLDFETVIRNQLGLVLTLNYEWLTLRASRHQAGDVTFNGISEITALQTGLNALYDATGADGYAQAAAEMDVNDMTYTFDELALKVEWNNFLFVTEIMQLSADQGPLDTLNRAYASVGYNFGPVMLHYTRTVAEDDVADLSSSIPVNIPGTEGQSMLLAAGADMLAENFATPDRVTDTIGVRWDFESAAAFKVELANIADEFGADGTTLRFAVDMVF